MWELWRSRARMAEAQNQRFLELKISNKTRDITLKYHGIHFFNGRILRDPKPSVAPGSSTICSFSNRSIFWGCNGVLVYEADIFTLAIYFSNPIDRNLFPMEMGLVLSLGKVHNNDLEATYLRLIRISLVSSDIPMFSCVILEENQDQVQLSLGPVMVTATMARGRSAVIRVEVEEQKESGEEAEGEKPRDVEGEKPRDAEGEKPRDVEGEKPRDVEGEKSWDFKGDTPKRSESLQEVLQDLKESPGIIWMA